MKISKNLLAQTSAKSSQFLISKTKSAFSVQYGKTNCPKTKPVTQNPPALMDCQMNFISILWNDTEDAVVHSLNYGFETVRFSISQRRVIILLIIPKKNKNLEYLKTAVISLEYIYYKIARKALVSCLEK